MKTIFYNLRKTATLFMIMSLFFVTNTYAATIIITENTNWSAITGGSGTNGIPNNTDTVIIRNMKTVTVDITNAICGSLQLGGPNDTGGSGTITFASSGSPVLTVTNAGGGTGNIALGGDGNNNRDGTVTFVSGATLIATGTITLGSSNATPAQGIINMTSGSNLKTGGFAIGTGSGTWNQSTGTVEMTATNTLPASIFTTFNNLIISGGTTTLGVAISVNALTINNAATLTPGARLITLSGNFVNNGTFTSGSGGITITGTATQSIGGFTTTGNVLMTKTGGTATFTGNANGAAFTLNGNGGTLNLGSGLTHTFTGIWTRTNGTLNGGSSTLNLGGSLSGTGGTFTAGTGTVNYSAAGNQTLALLAYNNLTLSGSGAKTIGSTTTIAGNLSIAPTGTAKASLNAGTTYTVRTLTLGGVGKNSGTWGSDTATTATNQTNTYFAATTGRVSVTDDSRPAITVTATGPSKTYGTALTAGTSTTNFSVTGTLISGEALTSVTLTPNTAGTTATTAAGSAYTVTPSLATGTGGFSASNYNITYTAFSGTVTAKALTITGLTGVNKAYDGATTATVTGTAALSGVLSGDAANVTLGGTGTYAFASAAVGTSKAITASGFSISGTASGNYTLSGTVASTNATANITAASLTITANNGSKTYGQTFTTGAGSANFTSSGLQNSETIGSITIASTGAVNTAAVGSYNIVPSAATGGTFTASNYSITYTNGTLTVGTAALTITANNQTKCFGTTFTFAGTEFTTSGLVGGNTVTSATLSSTGSASSATASTYPIVPTNAAGTGLANYTITYVNGTLTFNASPDISNFSIGVTNPAAGGTSTVTINSNSLANGTYTVTYNLAGNNTATGSTASVIIAAGTGTFATSALATAGYTTITITAIRNAANCSSTISSGNTATILIPTAGSITITTTGTWTAPVGVTSVTVEAWGGGGAGGGTTNAESGNANGGGGGGGGAYATKVINVTPSQTLNIVVGAGGIGNSGENGGNGGNSTITQFNADILAEGGKGGLRAIATTGNATVNGGSAGLVANSFGTTKTSGSNGGNGTRGYGISSGAGGAAASPGGGAGGASITGVSVNAGGNPGVAPGGGGGGSRTSENNGPRTGGAGGNGQVKITYEQLTYKSEIISTSLGSTNWCAGETRDVTVTIKNIGTATWTDGSGGTPTINIGVKWNTNGSNWTDYNVRTSANNLAPGETGTYTLTITASNNTGSGYTTALAAGTNNLIFDVVYEGIFWFGDNNGGVGPGNTVFNSEAQTILASPTVNAGTAFTKTCVANTSGAAIGETAEAGHTYSWSPSTGLSSANASNPTANPTTTTTYTVNKTNSTSGCTATGTVIVTVDNQAPTILVSANQSICAGSSATITASGATSYVWSNSLGTASSVTVSPSTTTTYQVTGTAENGCTNTASTTVSPAIPATPGTITGTASQCPALSGQTYSITAVTNATTYNWTVPTGWSITAGAGTTSITVTTGSGGQGGSISVKAQNACGTSSARTFAVTVSPATPATTETITGTATQCPGLTAQTYSIPAVTNATTYNWTVPTGWSITAGAGTTSITVTTGSAIQNGNVSVTAQNSCGTSTAQALAVTVNSSNTWTGTTISSWFTASNWSCGSAPTATSDVIIQNGSQLIVDDTSTTALANTITVSANSSLTVNRGNTLKVTDKVTNDGGTITFEDTASLVQKNDVANEGNIIYKRTTSILANNYDFVYWSSPVKEQKIGKIWMASNWADTFYNYDPTLIIPGWARTYEADRMIAGKGYIARARYGQSGVDGQQFTIENKWNAKFSGVPNNGTITVTDCVAGRDCLLGNPYPSAINADAFLTANSTVLGGTIYFWTHTTPIADNAYNSNDYASYNYTGSVAIARGNLVGGIPNDNKKPTGKIAAGQSFFATVLETPERTTVEFNNDMRLSTDEAPLDNTQFFRTSSAKAKTANSIEKHRVWLNVSNTQGAFKQTLVGYVTDATNGYDSRFDGESMNGNAYTDFYSINENKNLTIQGRALPFDQNDTVPLGFKTTIAGSFTIDIDEVDGLLANQAVYLEDKVTNTVSNLKNSNYTFTTAKGTFNDRFVLRYTDKTLSIDDTDQEDGILVFYSNNYKTLIIKNKVMDSTVNSVALFNMAGQNIEKWDVKDSGQTNIQIPIKNIPSGIYIVKVKTTKGESSKKIIVN